MSELNRVDFSWLLRLRWGAVTGQLAVILAAHFVLGVTLPMGILCALVAVEAATNLAVGLRVRRGRSLSERGVAAVMAFDILMLTALLYFSGGTFNPFSFLYLVNLALAAIVLRPFLSWALGALSLVSFGALYLFPATHTDHLAQMHLHVQGMWVAFAIAAAFITWFVQRVTRALGEREAELQRERTRRERDEKLTGFATLAAGAAHELSTPLATIAVVARELELASANEHAKSDAALIREQVERCRSILSQMAFDAGASQGDVPEPVEVRALIAEALDGLGEQDRVRVSAEEHVTVAVPRRAMAQALRGVVKNALQASRTPVEVRVEKRSGAIRVVVNDEGPGMPPEVLQRIGEPFFTTKAPGDGMGLGVYLTRAILEQLGGALEYESHVGRGTTAMLSLPASPASIRRSVAVASGS